MLCCIHSHFYMIDLVQHIHLQKLVNRGLQMTTPLCKRFQKLLAIQLEFHCKFLPQDLAAVSTVNQSKPFECIW